MLMGNVPTLHLDNPLDENLIFDMFLISTPETEFHLGQTFPPEKAIPLERTALMQRPLSGGDTLL